MKYPRTLCRWITLMEDIEMPSESLIYQQAKLLNKYYEKVGKAAAGEGRAP